MLKEPTALATARCRHQCRCSKSCRGDHPCAVLRPCIQTLHSSAAAQLAEAGKPPGGAAAAASSSAESDAAEAAQQAAAAHQQGATESVLFGSVGRAAAEARSKGGSGVPAITKFLGFSGELVPAWLWLA